MTLEDNECEECGAALGLTVVTYDDYSLCDSECFLNFVERVNE